MRICHISTAHPRQDLRIFYKMCHSLKNLSDDIHLVVADGLGNDAINGIFIHDAGKPSGRINRFIKKVNNAKKIAKEINAKIYHLHDPELLRIAHKLKKFNDSKIIYDAHEDLPRQVLSKHYIPNFLRKIVSKTVEFLENRKVRNIDGIITATPYIRKRFSRINKNTKDINNFPAINEFEPIDNWNDKEKSIGYVGGIFKTRGIIEMLDSISGTDITLHLAGYFSPKSLEKECTSHKGWQNVKFYGYLGRDKINDFLKQICAGLVLLEATPSYLNSLPVKMFEYMASGIPVVASDFRNWKDIVEKYNCGICVDQTNSHEIKEKIINLLNNKELLKEMGNNGRKIVIEKYNWSIEEKKLLKFYKELFNS